MTRESPERTNAIQPARLYRLSEWAIGYALKASHRAAEQDDDAEETPRQKINQIANALHDAADRLAKMEAENAEDCARIERLWHGLKGMLHEWDKIARYGSPMAKAANERVAFARAALTDTASAGDVRRDAEIDKWRSCLAETTGKLAAATIFDMKRRALEEALWPFTFPAHPERFQSDDGGCTEAIIEDADVQRARAALTDAPSAGDTITSAELCERTGRPMSEPFERDSFPPALRLMPARDGIEAQHGLNDVYPGDPYPVPDASAGDVRRRALVKPLRWSSTPPVGMEGTPGAVYADGLGGDYCAQSDGLLWWAHDPFQHQQFGSIDEAKAAAQKDHEKRISALIATPPQPVPTVQEAARVLLEWMTEGPLRNGVMMGRAWSAFHQNDNDDFSSFAAVTAFLRALSQQEEGGENG